VEEEEETFHHREFGLGVWTFFFLLLMPPFVQVSCPGQTERITDRPRFVLMWW